MGKFGWSYPPGCNSVPGDEPDPPCAICRKVIDSPVDPCTCPECPGCGEIGNPDCYGKAGHLPDLEAPKWIDTLSDLLFAVEGDRGDGMDGDDMAKRIARRLYKSTSCGISFWTDGGRVIVTGYCEGTDRECQGHAITYPFREADFWAACDEADADGCAVWNETHGCEKCWPEGEYGEHDERPINPGCPECKGQGTII